MNERYRVGAPDGLTGPTTPNIDGATVCGFLLNHDADETERDKLERPHVVVTRGTECVAIFPWAPEGDREPGQLCRDEAYRFAQMFVEAANAAECVPA
jgi:hypothetical protein